MTQALKRMMVAAVLAALGGVACDENLSDVAGPTTPNLEPTLSSIQREIFNVTDSSGRLACTQCHTDNGRTPAANLNLLEGRSHAQLVGRASGARAGAILVIPNDPENSYLIHKLDAPGRYEISGQRMPRGTGPFLTPGQIRIIRRWIELGAKND